MFTRPMYTQGCRHVALHDFWPVTATNHVLPRNASHSELGYRGRGMGCERGALLGVSSLSAHDLQPVLARGGAHGGGCQAVQPAPLHPPPSHPHPICTNTHALAHSLIDCHILLCRLHEQVLV